MQQIKNTILIHYKNVVDGAAFKEKHTLPENTNRVKFEKVTKSKRFIPEIFQRNF